MASPSLRALAVALASFISLAVAAPALAAGDPAAGEAQSAPCAACHGQDGATGLDPTYPNLAGQNEKYLLHQLKAVRGNDLNVQREGQSVSEGNARAR